MINKKIRVKSYTVREVSQIMGMNIHDTYSLTLTKDFPIVRDGVRAFVPKVEFDKWYLKRLLLKKGG